MVAVTSDRRPPWLLAQRWSDLLFAHWPVDPSALARRLPAGIEPDVHEGKVWLAIVAFRMLDTRPALAPGRTALPPIPELNVRTYVLVNGIPGVWFLSLDTSSLFFVTAGRTLYGLPYKLASMTTVVHGDRVHYLSCRHEACFAASYEPCGRPQPAQPGTLEHFLVERYRLFAQRRGRLITAVVAHAPWPLRPARARIELNRMAYDGLAFHGEPVLHFVDSVEARISVPQQLSALESGQWWPPQSRSSPMSTATRRRSLPSLPSSSASSRI
jgi:uncharacterized protein YqjF (DUF2071 family)